MLLTAIGRTLNASWSGQRIHKVNRLAEGLVALLIRAGEGRRPELIVGTWPGLPLLFRASSALEIPLTHRQADRTFGPLLEGTVIRRIQGQGTRLMLHLDSRALGPVTLTCEMGTPPDLVLVSGDTELARLGRARSAPRSKGRPRAGGKPDSFGQLRAMRPDAAATLLREIAGELDGEVAEGLLDRVLAQLDELIGKADESRESFWYRRPGRAARWSPIVLRALEDATPPWTREPAGPILDALEAEYARTLPGAQLERARAQILRRLARERRTLERRRDHLLRDLERAENADRERRHGEALLASLHLLRRGDVEAKIPDPYTGSPLELPLDPRLDPHSNADAYFKRARKARDAEAHAKTRLAITEKELEKLTIDARLAQDSETPSALAPLDHWAPDLHWSAPRPGGGRSSGKAGAGPARSTGGRPSGAKGRPTEHDSRFRRYELPGAWIVLAAKNARDNDVLTQKVAHMSDLWFHARGAPGSHVILRCAGSRRQPDKATLETVAAIAAYHSKARNSNLVPVAFAEKRHVRKPRGAKAGLVIMNREKVVFVEPALPEGYRH